MSGAPIELTVSEDDDGQRLDRWLKREAKHIPYVLVQKLVRKGAIRIDGKRCKPDARIAAGQKIKLPAVENHQSAPGERKKGVSEKDAAFIRSLVIYDDGDVLAINKPCGLAVQGGTSTKRHVAGMLEALKNKKGVVPRIVHRLDKDTSGVLLLARSAEVARALGEALKKREVKKIYWALVSPPPKEFSATIKAPLLKAAHGSDKEKIHIDEAGKYAETEYEVLERAHEAAAFVAFWPRTGRTHQIRAHAAYIGAPVLGDRKYASKIEALPQHAQKGEIDLGGVDIAPRLHLHAQRIICRHPTKKGQRLDIKADLPPELKKSWRALGFNPTYNEDPFPA